MRLLRPVRTRRYNMYRFTVLMLGSVMFGLSFSFTQIQLFIDSPVMAMAIMIGYAGGLAVATQIVFGYLEYRAMRGNDSRGIEQ